MEYDLTKTLFVSDLDGTLLTPSAEITPFTENTLNEFIKAGGCFTAATARTDQTVGSILKNVNLNLPVVLMNGVLIYDIKKQRSVKVKYIESSALKDIFASIRDRGCTAFVFGFEDDKMSCYYENLNTEHAKKYYEDRTKRYNKRFIHTDSFYESCLNNTVYISMTDSYEKLAPIYDEVKKSSLLRAEFYLDVYNPEAYYLEIFNSSASKKQAVSDMKQLYGFERVVAFGDNTNDIPMFEIADEAYAVENACEQAKQRACGIIKANIQDGVAWFIRQISNK